MCTHYVYLSICVTKEKDDLPVTEDEATPALSIYNENNLPFLCLQS